MLTCENAAAIASQAIAKFSEAPLNGACSGRGIVICGGGIKYGTCAWVTIRVLRKLGCKLPIEVWSLNEDEHDPHWAKLAKPFGVTTVCAADVQTRHPHSNLRGWQLKPYAMLHSRFREILLLDADNVPVSDPTFLFDEPEYQSAGAIFWPDSPNTPTPPQSIQWKVFGVDYRADSPQESGQVLVDKGRCWKALNLCNWYNEQSHFFYEYVYGDKDTFRFAWYRMQQPIAWVPVVPDTGVPRTFGQRDFQGQVLFQHRIGHKWSLYGRNQRIPRFIHEQDCHSFVDELRCQWEPQHHLMRNLSEHDRQQVAELEQRQFLYDRPGNNRWRIRLGAEGKVSEGYGPNEYFWWCENDRLAFVGFDGKRKSILRPLASGDWETEMSTLRGIQVRLAAMENDSVAI